MAIDDLSESMTNLAEFMDKTFLNDIAKEIRNLRNEIEKVRNENRIDDLKSLIIEIRKYFEGWGGGLCDILFCKENNNIPEGMTKEFANETYAKLLDDLFFNILFWDTEKNKALKKFHKAMNIYDRMSDKVQEKFIREHPEAERQKLSGWDSRLPMRMYYHWDSDWFRNWSDLGKLPKTTSSPE